MLQLVVMLRSMNFKIEDEDILQAIKYHTTGRAGMSNLEKIIYISDMIEPSRQFFGVERFARESGKRFR